MMQRNLISAALAAALGLASCADDGGAAAPNTDTTSDTTADSGPGADTTTDAATPDTTPDAGPDAGSGLAIDEAAEAPVTATVDFERPVSTSVAAGPYVFLLYADKDADVLDLNDPESPEKYGPITTAGPVLAVAYDEANHLAYLADATGEVQAVDLTALEAPVMAGKLSIPTLGKEGVKIARIGDQLFVASGTTLQPLGITRTASNVTLALQAPVVLASPVATMASGAGALFVGDEAGTVTAWDRGQDGKLAKGASLEVGGELRGIVSKGSRILVASKGRGLSVVDFGRPEPEVVYETAEIDDVTDIALFGRTVVVSLEREAVATIDVSDFTRPRVVSTNKGSRPDYIAMSRGTLFFGGASSGKAASVPPFVSARIPEKSREAFPRRRIIPLTLSKAVDPATVSADTVRLTCGGQPIAGEATVDPSATTIRFRPLAALPPGADCELALVGVADTVGQPVVPSPEGPAASFTTATEEDAPITNPASKYPHTADGGFTDWEPGKAEHEWFDVAPAKGVYTYFYADFDGESLWILNDWFYSGDDIDPDCYNQFYVYTGGGAEAWDIRAFGDQHVEVRRNGELVDPETEEVEGGATYGPSPNVEEPHTMYEIRLPASPGPFTVQLHDPGPTFACTTLEQEPTPIAGDLASGDGNITTTIVTPPVDVPPAAELAQPADGAFVQAPVQLTWSLREDAIGITMMELQVSANEAFEGKLVANALTYGTSYLLPEKLVTDGATYYWRVIAWTPAGSEASSTWSFTIGEEQVEGPLAVDDTAVTTAGVPIEIPVLANDEGVELRLIAATQGGGGTTEVGLGFVSYMPNEGFVGEDSFTYTIQDANDLQATGTVTVTVNAGSAGTGFSLYGGALPTVGQPISAAVGDFDGNGRVDIVVGDVNGPNISVFPSNKQGGVGFGERIDLIVPGQEVNAHAVAAGDLNGDGRADIASISQWSSSLTVFLGTPAAADPFSQGFTFPTQATPSAVGIDDIDGDGLADIVVASSAGLSVFVNGSQGQLELVLQPATTFDACTGAKQLVIADLNLDERKDIAMVCEKGGFTLLANHSVEGDVVLTNIQPPAVPSSNGIAAADLDGDGRVELALSSGNDGGGIYVLPNFTEGGSELIILGSLESIPVGHEVRGISAAQLGGSEHADLAIAGGNAALVSVFENTTAPGAITFAAKESFEAGQIPVMTVPADLDKNGHVDVVVVDGSAKAILILVNDGVTEAP